MKIWLQMMIYLSFPIHPTLPTPSLSLMREARIFGKTLPTTFLWLMTTLWKIHVVGVLEVGNGRAVNWQESSGLAPGSWFRSIQTAQSHFAAIHHPQGAGTFQGMIAKIKQRKFTVGLMIMTLSMVHADCVWRVVLLRIHHYSLPAAKAMWGKNRLP